jgi:hypothetical protein
MKCKQTVCVCVCVCVVDWNYLADDMGPLGSITGWEFPVEL